MDNLSKEQLIQDLNKAKANIDRGNHMRQVLLEAITKNDVTKAGEDQHAKLETVEASIASNTEIKNDIEATLAMEHKYVA